MLKPRRTPYHHPHLRGTLLRAAVRLIAQRGPAGFTLREVARRARVSHNAPYRHFRNKDALLAAVAEQGYRELNEAMLAAARRETTALARLKRAGWAYVSFALRRPEYLAVMFDAPFPKEKYPECAKAGEDAFGTLVALIGNYQREENLPAGDPKPLALAAWSLVHGIAKLAVTGRLPFASGEQTLRFAEWALDHSFLR